MDSPAQTTTRKPWSDWLVVIVFAALLWLPTVDFFTGVDITRQPSENRLLAPKPRLAQLNFSGLRAYLTASELYFNDHFGFRKRLIRWFQQWKRVFRDRTKEVFVGGHGWLFFSGQQMLENYMGTAKFTPAELQTWQKVLEKRRDWLAARGIQYYFVIAPDKHNIYPEELPSWLRDATPASRETKLDQFEKFMRAHSTVRIVDLRAALLAAKTNAPLYLQNDTHWNAIGAFVGSQEIIKNLSKDFPDLPPLRFESFVWTNAPSAGGDVARMLGEDPAEKNFYSCGPKPPLAIPPIVPVTNLPMHVWGVRNTNAVSAIAENPPPLRETAVIFHDSFLGTRYRPFLAMCFKQVLFVWENREFNTQIIGEYQPKIVVNEMLERFFETQNPEELLMKDAVP